MSLYYTLQGVLGRVAGFRAKRRALFIARFGSAEGLRIIDLGGYPGDWGDKDPSWSVVVVNTDPRIADQPCPPGVTVRVGSALELPYPDGSFDVAYSNSVIEHLYTWENQKRFRHEARRVAHVVWIQTPARECPFEFHWLTPFVHWLPKETQKRIARRGTVAGWLDHMSAEKARDMVDELRLLSYPEMRKLFPDCEIYVERFLGLTKSYIAIRG